VATAASTIIATTLRARTATASGCRATIATSRRARSGRIASIIVPATVRTVIARTATAPAMIVLTAIAHGATVRALIAPTASGRTVIVRRDKKRARSGASVASEVAAARPDSLS